MSESKQMRRVFVGGNWKCNGTRKSVQQLVADLNAAHFPKDVDAVVAPTALHLDFVLSNLKNNITVAAQNASKTKDGAYTGEMSTEMIKDFGVDWVILGHSERRQYYGETSEVVGEKVARALAAKLSVILCIGENLDERKAEKTLDVVLGQLKTGVAHVQDWSKIVLAYEPVWAIGTGLNATPKQAQDVHHAIREWLGKNVSSAVAESTRIIYGGSVKANNCDELITEKDVDGFLVGGASLVSKDFIRILNASKGQHKL